MGSFHICVRNMAGRVGLLGACCRMYREHYSDTLELEFSYRRNILIVVVMRTQGQETFFKQVFTNSAIAYLE